jgi:hypothetical protein
MPDPRREFYCGGLMLVAYWLGVLGALLSVACELA